MRSRQIKFYFEDGPSTPFMSDEAALECLRKLDGKGIIAIHVQEDMTVDEYEKYIKEIKNGST